MWAEHALAPIQYHADIQFKMPQACNFVQDSFALVDALVKHDWQGNLPSLCASIACSPRYHGLSIT